MLIHVRNSSHGICPKNVSSLLSFGFTVTSVQRTSRTTQQHWVLADVANRAKKVQFSCKKGDALSHNVLYTWPTSTFPVNHYRRTVHKLLSLLDPEGAARCKSHGLKRRPYHNKVTEGAGGCCHTSSLVPCGWRNTKLYPSTKLVVPGLGLAPPVQVLCLLLRVP